MLSIKVPRSEILVADQGQIGFLGSAAGRRGGGQRAAGAMVRGASGRRQDHRRQSGGGRASARGGAKSARAHAPQGRARRREPAGQTRRLSGARSGEVGDFHRRGRLGGRHRQTGAQPRISGGVAVARQNPQCRARAVRQDAVERAGGNLDHRARRRHRRRRLQPRKTALSQDHHHDRRGRRRLAHPHPAAHLLLPPDAADHRERLFVHRSAAALQGQARLVRAVSQGRARDGRFLGAIGP